MRTPRVEVCEIGKFLGSNALLSHMANNAKENLGDLIHECPYEGVKIF
jgi:hypothetical protein